MKKIIGGTLVFVTVLLLLLVTCDGPGLWPASERSVVEAPTAPSGSPDDEQATGSPVPAAPEAPETAAVGGASAPSPAATTPAEEAPAPVVTATAASAPAASGRAVPAPSATTPAPSSPPAEAVAPRAPVSEPEGGGEALLAVSPRALEGGTGAPVLLVSADSLRRELRIPMGDERHWLSTGQTRGHPASTINTPTAYGQQWGDLYAGVGYQDRIRYDDWSDGVAAFSLGLGNPARYVGLDVSVSLLDTYTEFGKDRSLSLKLHRHLPYRTAIAVGHENIWHTDGTDGGSSRYVVVSKVMLLRDQPTAPFGSMVVNAGLGNDRFLSEPAFARGDDGVNAFGSVGLRVLRPVNAVANWTGQDLALGLSIAPVRSWPLVITPAVMDVTGRAGDGARLSVSAGLSYNFRR